MSALRAPISACFITLDSRSVWTDTFVETVSSDDTCFSNVSGSGCFLSFNSLLIFFAFSFIASTILSVSSASVTVSEIFENNSCYETFCNISSNLFFSKKFKFKEYILPIFGIWWKDVSALIFDDSISFEDLSLWWNQRPLIRDERKPWSGVSSCSEISSSAIKSVFHF